VLEVEVKIEVTHDRIEDSLREHGAVLEKQVTHYDIYFQHPNRDFSVTDEALRIREIDEKDCILTYKGPKIGVSGKVRKELEVKIEDPESLTSILEIMGFNSVGHVRKVRRCWKLHSAEVAVDRVDGLGDFMELEFVVPEDQATDALEKARAYIKKLGLDPEKEIRTSYLELILEKEEHGGSP